MRFPSLLAVLIAITLVACGQKDAATPAATPQAALPPGHPPIEGGKMNQAAPTPSLTQKAEVVSTIDVQNYTYIEAMQDNKTRWLAAATIALKKGYTIQFNDGTVMTNFNSKTLNRVFPSITFVSRVVVANGKT